MSPAAYAMLMGAAKEEFRAAFSGEDLEAIESALGDIRRLHQAYYGYDAFCASAAPASQRNVKVSSN